MTDDMTTTTDPASAEPASTDQAAAHDAIAEQLDEQRAAESAGALTFAAENGEPRCTFGEAVADALGATDPCLTLSVPDPLAIDTDTVDDDVDQADTTAAPAGDPWAGTNPPPAPPAPGRVTVNALALRELLRVANRFTDANAVQPVMRTVRLEAGNNEVALTAVNNYAAVHVHGPAAGTFAVPPQMAGEHAAALVALLGSDLVDRTTVATLTVTTVTAEPWPGSHLTVNAGPVALTVPVLLDAEYPHQIGNLFTAGDWDPEPLEEPVAFTPRKLAMLSEALGDDQDYEPARLYFRGPNGPMRAEVGTWLVAVFMPTRLGADAPGRYRPVVPWGLPEQPATLRIAVDDEPTETTYPRDERHAGAERLSRWFLTQVSNQTRRMFTEPWPDLPKYDDQNPEQRRIARAQLDLVSSMCHAYAAGAVLRAFHERHPEQADAVARELWADLDAGEGLSEWAYEWLQTAGVDPAAAVRAAGEAEPDLIDKATAVGAAIRTAAADDRDDDTEPDETGTTD